MKGESLRLEGQGRGGRMLASIVAATGIIGEGEIVRSMTA